MFQEKSGAMPPFMQVAVNVTAAPWQTGFTDGEIVTDNGLAVFTVMMIEFELTVAPEEGQDILEIISHVITSLFCGEYENTGEFEPRIRPFTFQ